MTLCWNVSSPELMSVQSGTKTSALLREMKGTVKRKKEPSDHWSYLMRDWKIQGNTSWMLEMTASASTFWWKVD